MKLYRNIVLGTLLLLVATTTHGCIAHGGKYVFAIAKTSTYHREDCSVVRMARTIKMTLSEAKTEHLKPCPLCKPELD